MGKRDEDTRCVEVETSELPTHTSRPIDEPRQASRPTPGSKLRPFEGGRGCQSEARILGHIINQKLTMSNFFLFALKTLQTPGS